VLSDAKSHVCKRPYTQDLLLRPYHSKRRATLSRNVRTTVARNNSVTARVHKERAIKVGSREGSNEAAGKRSATRVDS
jgi:hypothetical protein